MAEPAESWEVRAEAGDAAAAAACQQMPAKFSTLNVNAVEFVPFGCPKEPDPDADADADDPSDPSEPSAPGAPDGSDAPDGEADEERHERPMPNGEPSPRPSSHVARRSPPPLPACV